MKHRFLKLICATLCFIFIFSINSFALSIDNTDNLDESIITEPYDYPIIPGTNEWKSLTSHKQMIEACKIPENILKNMTTEALFETMMNYPLLSDMLFYDDKDLGYKIMKENCSLFNELFSRSDVKEVFELYASSELYTCSSAIPFEEQIKLTCFNIIYNSEFEESYQIMSAGEVTNSNVKTPNGTKVPHIEGLTFNGHGYYGTTEDLDKEMKKKYPNAVKISTANPSYNCHSYAWHSTSTNNFCWINNPKYYWTDNSYIKTTSPKNADKVLYKNGTSNVHSAIYFNASTKEVYSKWGYYGVYKHSRGYSPYDATSYVSYKKS